jgi:hypothetical protein
MNSNRMGRKLQKIVRKMCNPIQWEIEMLQEFNNFMRLPAVCELLEEIQAKYRRRLRKLEHEIS